MAVCSEIHTKHVNTAVWAERGIVEGSAGGTCSDRWAAEDEMIYGTDNLPTTHCKLEVGPTNNWDLFGHVTHFEE